MREMEGAKPFHFNAFCSMFDSGKVLRSSHIVTLSMRVISSCFLPVLLMWLATVNYHDGLEPTNVIQLMKYLFSDGVSMGNESFSWKKYKMSILF